MKPPISVFIIAKNEADRIAEVINAVKEIADEILVIEDGRNLVHSYYQKMIDGGFDDEIKLLKDISKPFKHIGKPNSFNNRTSRSSKRIFSL